VIPIFTAKVEESSRRRSTNKKLSAYLTRYVYLILFEIIPRLRFQKIKLRKMRGSIYVLSTLGTWLYPALHLIKKGTSNFWPLKAFDSMVSTESDVETIIKHSYQTRSFKGYC
jgi:hypothetical protein